MFPTLRKPLMAAARLQMAPARRAASTSAWFRDPATYPLLGILGSAVCLCTDFIAYFTTSHPDVRFNKRRRTQLLREEAK